MKRIFVTAMLALIVPGLLVLPVWAGGGKGAAYDTYTLGEIVVTGDRPGVEQMALTTVITAEEIEVTGSQNVAEALAHAPGITVSTGRKDESDVSIHGFAQNKTLILIDGVPFYETYYGKLDLKQIPTDIIAKIEITKGAASVLYGANAEAGVINIVTRKAAGRPTVSASLDVADGGGMRASVSHGMRTGKFNYWINFSRREADATRLSGDFTKRTGLIWRKPGGKSYPYIEDGGYFRDNSDYQTDSLWAKIGFEPSRDAEYFVNFHHSATEKGVPANLDENQVLPNPKVPSDSPFSFLCRKPEYNDWGVDLSGRQAVSDRLTFKGKVFYHEHTDDYASYNDIDHTVLIATSRYEDYMAGGMVMADLRLAEPDHLRLAVHYKGDSHKENGDAHLPLAESFSYTGSVALENEYALAGRFSIVMGASYDWMDVSKAKENVINAAGAFVSQIDNTTPGIKDSVNPMIGGNWFVSDTLRVFGSVAQKTRFPALHELYSGTSGNPKLDAERSNNYTLGLSKTLDGLELEIAGFFHDISDRIERFDKNSLYLNSEKIHVYGVEATAIWTPLADLTLKMDCTLAEARDKGDTRVTDDVVDVPEVKIGASASYLLSSLGTRFDVNLQFVGRTWGQLPTPGNPNEDALRTESYNTMGARITQPLGDHWQLHLTGTNLMDRAYEPEAGYPAPGRTLWAGVSMNY
ncbi:MAG: TonB-dependent receptor [Desulfobacterales bacterium]|nr:TonB-dependent receptor [Desulfobacterales bacterium]